MRRSGPAGHFFATISSVKEVIPGTHRHLSSAYLPCLVSSRIWLMLPNLLHRCTKQPTLIQKDMWYRSRTASTSFERFWWPVKKDSFPAAGSYFYYPRMAAGGTYSRTGGVPRWSMPVAAQQFSTERLGAKGEP
jgi:hypothetical protein